MATVRGNRNTKHVYSTIVFGTEGIVERAPPSSYRNLIVQILEFYRTGIAPVPPRETIEILTFMEAADVSQRRGGVPVALAEVLRDNGGDEGL